MTDGLEAITKPFKAAKRKKKYPRFERVASDGVYLNGRLVSLTATEYRIDKETVQVVLDVSLRGDDHGTTHHNRSIAIIHEPKRKKAKP